MLKTGGVWPGCHDTYIAYECCGIFLFYLHEQIVNNWPITDIFPLVVEITQKHSCIFFDHHLMEEREKKRHQHFCFYLINTMGTCKKYVKKSAHLVKFSIRKRWRYQVEWLFGKIKTAFDPSPLIFGKSYCNFFLQISCSKALFKGAKSAV